MGDSFKMQVSMGTTKDVVFPKSMVKILGLEFRGWQIYAK